MYPSRLAALFCLLVLPLLPGQPLSAGALVFQSDFGLRDAAVAAMKGVAVSVAPDLRIYDLTHEIAPYDIWEAALRLEQGAPYWPPGTVFVSVVDPGVGTARVSVVMQSRTGHYFVTPDNGTLTFVAELMGVQQVREIDEAVNRRAGSAQSYTFHGRDVYAYTGARLASGQITFEQVGRDLGTDVQRFDFEPARQEGGKVLGTIVTLDPNYGNVWTNVAGSLLEGLGLEPGDLAGVRIRQGSREVVHLEVPWRRTFGEVGVGEALLYLNSLDRVALAINQGSLAGKFAIGAGPDWSIEINAVRIAAEVSDGENR